MHHRSVRLEQSESVFLESVFEDSQELQEPPARNNDRKNQVIRSTETFVSSVH